MEKVGLEIVSVTPSSSQMALIKVVFPTPIPAVKANILLSGKVFNNCFAAIESSERLCISILFCT